VKVTVLDPDRAAPTRDKRDTARRQQALMGLAESLALIPADLPAAAQKITETAAQAVAAERVAFWRRSPEGTTWDCIDVLDAEGKTHSGGESIPLAVSGPLLQTLQEDGGFVTFERLDPRLEALSGCLAPASQAVLVSAIPLRSDVAGFLVLERFESSTSWSAEERVFLDSVAVLAALGGEAAERGREAAQLREREDRYRDLVDNSADLICTHDLDGRILSANRALITTLGYRDPDDIVGWKISDFLAPEAKPLFPAYLEALARDGAARGFMKVLTRDGEPRIFEFNNTVRIEGVDRPVVRGMGRDVSEAKRAERQLAERANFERFITQLSTEFITIPPSEIDAAMGKTLSLVGHFLSADVAFTVVFTEENRRADVTHRWSAEGGSVMLRLHSLRTENFPWVREKMRWFETIRLDRLEDFPPEAASERRMAEERGLRALLAVPIVLSGAVAGIVALGSRKDKEWSEDAAGLLRRVGEILGSAFARKRVEEALRSSEERYRSLFERNLAGVYRSTLEGRILDCNDACARILGFASREELLAYESLELYFNLSEREAILARLREKRLVTNFEVCLRRRDGSPVWVLENVARLAGPAGEPDFLEGTLIDITDRRQAEAQLSHQASHDMLTGLPNRLLLSDRLARALTHEARSGLRPAVLFVDLDHFKTVNDTLGHDVGDELLKAVAARLKECVREEDTVCRLGGDEFVIVLHDVSQGEDAVKVAHKILEQLAAPFLIDEHCLYATASIGVSLYPQDGQDAATLLRNADAAMYRAKTRGRNNYQVCDPSVGERAAKRLALEKGLQRAVTRGEFIVFYQPQVSLKTDEIVGVEALVRWRDPERGLIPPGEFIPIAEENRLILPIGEWVLRTALHQVRQWHLAGFPGLKIGVNLSARQFEQPNLARTVGAALRSTGISPDRVELEITETVAMLDGERTIAVLAALKDLGLMISIDDFGTGHSAMSYLKRFPINSIKVDQSFVRDLPISPADAAIVKAMIDIAHGLRLRVVAEGVDSEEQKRILKAWKCDELQGFLFSRPVSAEAMRDLLEKHGARKMEA
jgi:diguanylate cyclase (GGDEF)-like protein/PAS domain S-box-containing protein